MGRPKKQGIDKELRELLDGLPCCNPSCDKPQIYDLLGPVGLCKEHHRTSHKALYLQVRSSEPEYQIHLGNGIHAH